MNTVPAPSLTLPREEWPDADFDIPDGHPLHTEFDKGDEDEDWNMEMDLGTANVKALAASLASSRPSGTGASQIIAIRPPPTLVDDDEGEDDEGVSTIKVTAFPKSFAKTTPKPVEEDFEDGLALPSDLTQLSLAPLSLNHRNSKNSLEWGEKDQTSSSQSSDAYSTFGFAGASPSSNSASSVSLPGSETEDDEDDGDLEGLVIPPGLFESGEGGKKLTKLLELKKKALVCDDQVASPDPEDDFEMGLVIDDDVDLSPSRLLLNSQSHQPRPSTQRSESLPSAPSLLRPLSRLRERTKSPTIPPPSSSRQFQKLHLSPSPPHCTHEAPQSQPFLSSAPASTSFLSPKPSGVRGQKSHSALKPPTPPSSLRKLTRKASLSSLIEASQSQASGSGSAVARPSSKASRYETPTAASRAKSHTNSTGRITGLEYIVPPTRPSTPSSNPAALRLTLPTSSSRLKARPALSSVFGGPSSSQIPRSQSPVPPRPPSSSSTKGRALRAAAHPQPATPRVLKRPKRQRTYGDGTELDGIDDLPTDRDKERRFRVQPKGYGNRVPGGSYPEKSQETMRKKGRREGSTGNAALPPINVLKNLAEFPSSESGVLPKKKNSPSPGHTRRKPTLIRNLGGSGAPKVVGDMKWNPKTLRWEGNDHVLREFDAAVGTSTRPALITHLTGSSIGSPVTSFASGARIVGNMIFDPTRMCWISTLPPEDDEPDVFANLADDEEEGDGWETKGGTIRPNQQPAPSSDTSESSMEVEASPARSHTSMSESGSDRGSRMTMVCDVDECFVKSCRYAEERHRLEMKGWKSRHADMLAEPDRSNLYEIRALATRQYGS